MRILFVWDYDRKDLTDPVIKALAGAEVVFLNKYNSSATDVQHHFKIYYWNDFTSPYAVLNLTKPDKIVFMEVESFHQVALNIAALNKGIKTYRLEHGVKAPFSSYLSHKTDGRRVVKENISTKTKWNKFSSWNTILFYLRSFQIKNLLTGFMFLKFIFTRTVFGVNAGLYRCRFVLRRTAYYIDFTYFNSRFTRERDKPLPSQYFQIGNPYFDKYFSFIHQHIIQDEPDYYLLIDSGFVEDAISLMEIDTLLNFYRKLNEYCIRNNARLKIKLHPLTYNANYLPENSNIIFLKDVNVIEEIIGCKGCFHSHFSTLTPLALYFKPGILFDAFPLFNVDIKELNLLTILEFYSFNIDQIVFKETTETTKKLLLENYLFSTDGKAGVRLANILLN